MIYESAFPLIVCYNMKDAISYFLYRYSFFLSSISFSNKDLQKNNNTNGYYVSQGGVFTCYLALSHKLKLERMVSPFEKTLLVDYSYIYSDATIGNCWSVAPF